MLVCIVNVSMFTIVGFASQNKSRDEHKKRSQLNWAEVNIPYIDAMNIASDCVIAMNVVNKKQSIMPYYSYICAAISLLFLVIRLWVADTDLFYVAKAAELVTVLCTYVRTYIFIIQNILGFDHADIIYAVIF